MRNTHGCIVANQTSVLPRIRRSPRFPLVMLILVLLWLCAMPQPALAQGAIIRVALSGTDTTWQFAYANLHDAITAAVPGDEIWVAAGVYTPSVPAGQSATFTLKSGVAVYGGFAGTETLRTQRDWVRNVTVLSGDIDDNDSRTVSGVTPDPASVVGSNAYHVISAVGPFIASATLDGFTITAGRASSAENSAGGGLYVTSGAAVNLYNLTLQGNYALKTGGGSAVSGSEVNIDRCRFISNAASGVETYDGGGGLYAYDSIVHVTNSAFSGNQTGALGGGVNITGLSSTSGDVHLFGVLISGNLAKYGGGVSIRRSTYELANSTVAANRATTEGGGVYNNDTRGDIANSILWGNSPNDLKFGTLVVSYCVVPGFTSGINNINADPFFESPATAPTAPTSSGDYHLRPGSPAIDTGSDALVPSDLTQDHDGWPRISDGDIAVGAAVDRGAYEWPGRDLTMNVVGQGVVSPPVGVTYHPPERTVTLSATPETGWDFAGWSGDAKGTDLTTQVTMDASKVVTATFTSPSAVTMGSFGARSTPSGMLLTWDTATEIDMLGVTLRRRTLPDGPWVDLNRGEMIPVQGPGQLLGASYSYLDTDVRVGEHYTYLLEMVGFAPLATGPDAQHTVDARYWGYFWWLPILRGHVFSGP